jgi:hypothetical protein
LIDDRAGSLCTFAGSAADHYYQIDRGATGLDAITRLIIPSGHNLGGNTITLQADDDVAFGSATALLTTSAVAAGLIDKTFASNQERYLRLSINGTGTWAVPELVFTNTRTTTRGPEQGWVDMLLHNTLDFTKESGSIASLALGADRRLFELTYRDVILTADLLVFSDLISTCGTSKPFWVDEPFTGSDPIWMKLTEDSRQVQDPAIPAATDAPQKRIELSMLEHLA